jgi:hypothetical protein
MAKLLLLCPKSELLGNQAKPLWTGKTRPVVEKITEQISEAFGFDYNINIEMGCNSEGIPVPF